MADNTTLNSGTGGDVIATDDIVGVKYQRVKVNYGTDGSATDVSTTNPLPTTNDASAADGAAGLPSKAVVVAGYDGTNVQAIVTDSTGRPTVNVNGTVPVSAASLPLPTGASTAAKQPALGTAGTPSADVITVQGVTSMTALKVDGSAVTQPVSGTVGVSGTVTVDSELTTADLDTGAGTDTRAVVGLARAESGGAVLVGSANPLPVSGTVTANAGSGTFTVSGTVTANAGSGTMAVDSELPAAAALADAAANPTTPTVGAANLLYNGTTWDRIRGDTTNGIDVDVTRVSGTVTVDSELAAAAALADAASNPTTATAGAAALLYNGATWDRMRGDTTNGLDVDVTRLPALVAGSALVGRVNIDPQTSNGLTPSVTISAATTNATSVKGSAGQLYTIYCSNINAAVRYLKLYNKATSPTVGTDTPVLVFAIPGNTAGAGFSWTTDMGIAFSSGIAFALTTGVANSDTGAVAANEIVVNLGYK